MVSVPFFLLIYLRYSCHCTITRACSYIYHLSLTYFNLQPSIWSNFQRIALSPSNKLFSLTTASNNSQCRVPTLSIKFINTPVYIFHVKVINDDLPLHCIYITLQVTQMQHLQVSSFLLLFYAPFSSNLINFGRLLPLLFWICRSKMNKYFK